MISVDCDGCGNEIHSRSKITKGDAIQYNYECECGKVYFITILEGTKAYPVDDCDHASIKCNDNCEIDCRVDHEVERIPLDTECDCCDGSCKEQCDDEEDYKHPICPICEDRHFGICVIQDEDVPDPVPRDDAIVNLPDDYIIKDHEKEKCTASQHISTGEIIHTLALKKERLKLEKEILDLDEYLYHARERERQR